MLISYKEGVQKSWFLGHLNDKMLCGGTHCLSVLSMELAAFHLSGS
jgi:hypothetical protein